MQKEAKILLIVFIVSILSGCGNITINIENSQPTETQPREEQQLTETEVDNSENDIAHKEYQDYIEGNRTAVCTDNIKRYICEESAECDINYAYCDLNGDGIDELVLKEFGYWINVITYKSEELYDLGSPFYSGCTDNYILEDGLLMMLDSSHDGRICYIVCRLNENLSFDEIIWFMHEYPTEYYTIPEDEYSVSEMEDEIKTISKEEFEELEKKYTDMIIDNKLEWTSKLIK